MTDDEPLYDVLIPPGVPQKIIFDVTEKFDVKVVERMEKTQVRQYGRRRSGAAGVPGTMETAQKVEKYMIEQLKAFVEEK